MTQHHYCINGSNNVNMQNILKYLNDVTTNNE